MTYQLASVALEKHGLNPSKSLRNPSETATFRTNNALFELGQGNLLLEDFMKEYGHRSSCSWELFATRWAENPSHVMGLAKSSLKSKTSHESDSSRELLPKGTKRLVGLACEYLQLREDQRFVFEKLLWEWKKTYLFLERDCDLELRFLEVGEMEQYVNGDMPRKQAQDLVDRRKSEWSMETDLWLAGKLPSMFLSAESKSIAPSGGKRLDGQGVSVGVVTGPVKIVRTMNDVSMVEAGDILVLTSAEPGWTVLFEKCGGLIMEMGGLLSHGAVVAREYGLPAVSNIVGVSTILTDGQRVTVDGRRGAVWIR